MHRPSNTEQRPLPGQRQGFEQALLGATAHPRTDIANSRSDTRTDRADASAYTCTDIFTLTSADAAANLRGGRAHDQ